MQRLALSIHLHSWLKRVASIWVLPIVLSAGPALGATTITVQYGIFERSVSVDSLRIYAEQGKVEPDLRILIRSLDQPERLKSLLLNKVNLSEVTVSQFLYTAPGEMLLRQLAQVIRTDANLSGFYAIRGALIQAAADPEGLTLLNVLEKFPLNDVRVDLSRAMRILRELETLVQQSQAAINLVEHQFSLEVNAQPWKNTFGLPDLRSPGRFTWQKLTIQVNNPQHNRSFPADLYLPQNPPQASTQATPVVVISHGLGSDRTTFAYLAEQLASYGFAVAVPEHPGSDAQHIQHLASGEVNQVIQPSELINRPLDVKYLLDKLAHLSQSHAISRQLDLQRVGVVGQSLGGYTALALAGASFNTQPLTAGCSTQDLLNLSLLLECQAQALPQPLPALVDHRVKAVVAVDPIGSSLFQESGFKDISIPVMIVSGSNDTVAPALLEQILPFTWLQTPNKYLALLQGGTHFSTIDSSDSDADQINLPSNVIGPDPTIAYTYLKALSVAFFETYIADNSSYRSHLTAAYAQTISQPLMPINLVQSLPSARLTQALER
ncbi:alpha/beta hydrolase [Phormidium tenue FACHB-886]|nr:alpha/beta hydrolase [Phormidium tenue FACHB-886]